MNQPPASLLRLVRPGTGSQPSPRSLAPVSDPTREQFLADLAERRRDGTLNIDPLAIADAILRRERC